MFATAIPAVAAIYLLACLLALAPRKPGYSHARHTISEIGERGAPDQRFVAWGLFFPVGLALLLVAWIVRSSSQAAAELALCMAVGYLGAAAFPCDPGSPLSGSARQGVHNLAGAVEYIGGGLALVALAERLGQAFKFAGFTVLGVAIVLTIVPSNPVRGLIQRIAEACLFGGLALAVWRVSGTV